MLEDLVSFVFFLAFMIIASHAVVFRGLVLLPPHYESPKNACVGGYHDNGDVDYLRDARLIEQLVF